jgi:hypothetical protein
MCYFKEFRTFYGWKPIKIACLAAVLKREVIPSGLSLVFVWVEGRAARDIVRPSSSRISE